MPTTKTAATTTTPTRCRTTCDGHNTTKQLHDSNPVSGNDSMFFVGVCGSVCGNTAAGDDNSRGFFFFFFFFFFLAAPSLLYSIVVCVCVTLKFVSSSWSFFCLENFLCPPKALISCVVFRCNFFFCGYKVPAIFLVVTPPPPPPPPPPVLSYWHCSCDNKLFLLGLTRKIEKQKVVKKYVIITAIVIIKKW